LQLYGVGGAAEEGGLATSVLPRESSEEDGLLLIIRNERPIEVAHLAELFSALAKDYRRISNGGELVVVKVSQGSLTALFHHAAGAFTDLNSLITFGKALVAFTKIALGATASASKLIKGKRAGAQTVRSLAKLAFATGGDVEMKYQRSLFGSEEFHLKLTSREAKQIQDIASTKEPPPRAIAKEHKLVVGASMGQIPTASVRQMSDALVRLSKGGEGETILDIQALVDAIVGALAIHDPDKVLQIIAELEGQGQHSIGQLLSDALARAEGNRNTNRPLLT
jgi:hypothetical protein